MKYCKNCGLRFIDKATFCPKCGEKLLLVEEENKNEPVQEEVKEIEKPAPEVTTQKEEKKNFNLFRFLLTEQLIKYTLIIFGALLALSILFWVIALFIKVVVILKLLLILLNSVGLARIVFLFVKEIIKNKTNDLFNLFFKGTFVILHFALFIINCVFLFI